MGNQRISNALGGLLLLSALTAGAHESAQIEGSLDGELREWFVLSQGDDSNASFVERGDQLHIDVIGFADSYSWDAREALAMSLTVEQETLTQAEVVHLISSAAMPPLYTSKESEVTVTLSHFEQQGRIAHIAGRIEGNLALQEALGEPPNPAESVSIDVQFEIEAHKVEF